MASSLDPLLKPRTVAVVGASRTRGTIGAEIFHNLIVNGFTGAVYPVNPGATSVQGVKAYPTVAAVPDAIDLAVIVVPAARVPAVVDDCVAVGVKALLIVTAGFAETGVDGKAIQDALLAKVRAAGMRMVGPNCLGLLNADPAIALDATFAPTWPPHGSVAFSSQSGAVGLAILDYAKELGIGIHQFVSIGNKADVSGNDLIAYWGDDPAVKVILLYLESFGNPSRFLQITREVARRKPVVAVKSGRTGAGARAASSHTGSLAGSEVAVEALIAQAGVIRTDTIEELFDVAMILANQPVPRGGRVAILTNAGGPGIMCADACESHGLTIADLTPATAAALLTFLPPEASVRNPVDMIASARPASYERALPLLLADPNVDAVIALFVPPVGTEAAEVAAAILRGAAGATKPVLTSFMGMHGVPAALSSLREGRLPSYAFPEAAAIALARVARYGRWLARGIGAVPELADVDVARARAAIADHNGWLPAPVAREVLAAFGLTQPAAIDAATADAAAAAARSIGFPVAVKLASPTITHKTDVGGVVLDLPDEAAVAQAFADIHARLAARGQAAAMAGVTVQPMIPRGVELFVGATRAPGFGPLIGFGIGGVAVELWKDVAFRLHPLTDLDARELLDAIRGKALLDGFRGGPVADRAAVVDAIARVDRLMGALPEVAELDLNPVVALGPGRGVLAIDARIRLAGPDAAP
ncbi:MAG: acetate--CoA ligase family protein [Kofleriaceae bacterium]|nr:acetate--CoA ligase family protein [Kofleriaceae bacterium]MBP9167659.1 acetate--CoA ligase family protein [Kofleriaceae bacterium]MBP9861996.1 acetate--CoA ligase family protein [Kofleriaceae bacterium]